MKQEIKYVIIYSWYGGHFQVNSFIVVIQTNSAIGKTSRCINRSYRTESYFIEDFISPNKSLDSKHLNKNRFQISNDWKPFLQQIFQRNWIKEKQNGNKIVPALASHIKRKGNSFFSSQNIKSFKWKGITGNMNVSLHIHTIFIQREINLLWTSFSFAFTAYISSVVAFRQKNICCWNVKHDDEAVACRHARSSMHKNSVSKEIDNKPLKTRTRQRKKEDIYYLC